MSSPTTTRAPGPTRLRAAARVKPIPRPPMSTAEAGASLRPAQPRSASASSDSWAKEFMSSVFSTQMANSPSIL